MKIRLKFDREFHLIDPIFFKKKFRYIFQSFLASIALLLVLIIGDNIAQGAIIAGIAGTTALISFAPHSYASNTRRVVGGHVLSVIVGVFSIFLLSLFSVDYNNASNLIIYIKFFSLHWYFNYSNGSFKLRTCPSCRLFTRFNIWRCGFKQHCVYYFFCCYSFYY